MSDDEQTARRRVLDGIADESDRAAVEAIFARVDWRREHELPRSLTPADAERAMHEHEQRRPLLDDE